VDWFHELDAWTEYWDIYHPETHGRYYFGDGAVEVGLLTRFLPRQGRPPAFTTWSEMALRSGTEEAFAAAVAENDTAAAIVEVDELLDDLFAQHFGDPSRESARHRYLDAIQRFATDALPPATERAARIPDGDPRARTAGRHTLDSDLMWFAWALHIEGASRLRGPEAGQARRNLMMAGVACGCGADFAWRGHRRTRPEYHPDEPTTRLLHDRALSWATDFRAACDEVHSLYRIREWGHP
jgi:hypothetical protein